MTSLKEGISPRYINVKSFTSPNDVSCTNTDETTVTARNLMYSVR
jgi:hypothetical protein